MEGEGRAAWRRAPGAAIAGLALAASATGLANGFVYDDTWIIVQNPLVHDLRHWGQLFVTSYWPATLGGTLYRPVTLLAFALEWAIGGGSPLPFHLASVALYVAVSLAVYALAKRLLPAGAAWLAAAAFAVHPVHVEAVANVVGQSELLVALVVTSAVTRYLAWRAAAAPPVAGMPWSVVATIGGLYALGCLSKEHAIVLPALLLTAEATVVVDPRGWRDRAVSLWPLAASLFAIAGAYLIARTIVLHGVGGDAPTIAFRHATLPTRWWTMVGVVPEWVRLLAWPAHLAAIYGPPAIAVRDHADRVVLVGLFLLVGMGALAVAAWRRLPVAAFGIVWAAIALFPVSNVLIRSGVLLAERTLFLPSVGAALVIGAVAVVARQRLRAAPQAAPQAARRVAAVCAAAVLVAGAWRSALRQRVWHDNSALFAQAIVDEPSSYAAHFAYAQWLFASGGAGAGEREAGIAMQLYPDDPRVYDWLGIRFAAAGHCRSAERFFLQAIAMAPWFSEARAGLARCLAGEGDWAAVRSVARSGIAEGADVPYYRSLLRLADSTSRALSPRAP